MATIHEDLVLEDKFSGPFTRYIQLGERAEASTKRTQAALGDMAAASSRVAGGMASAANASDNLGNAAEIRSVSAATQELVNKLASAEAAFRNAFTDAEADQALRKLQSEMKRTGLVWTSTADQMESADMIARVGLQQLANQGRLAASYSAEKAFTDRRAAAAAQQAAAADRQAAAAASTRVKLTTRLKNAFTGLLPSIKKATSAQNILTRQVRRMSIMLLSAERIFRFMQASLEAAPEGVQESWSGAGAAVKNLASGTIIAALQAMQGPIDRLSAALNSEAGQKLAWGLQTLASVGGAAIGMLLDAVSSLVEFLGNNFETVMTVAGVLLALFAAKMLIAAAATLAANWPIILLVSLVAALVTGLMQAGVTSAQIFSAIGAGFGLIYAVGYNAIAAIWNIVASFAEFFANVFDNPVAAIVNLFIDLADAVLGVIETLAGAIGALLGQDWGAGIGNFRDKMQQWADDKFGEDTIKLDRMDELNVNDTMAEWAQKGSDLADKLGDFDPEKLLSGINANTGATAGSAGAIEKSLGLAEEELKSLVDVAEQRYVNRINLTSQTPVININGANTGNTQADRQRLADQLRDVLLEQMSAGSSRSTSFAYSGVT